MVNVKRLGCVLMCMASIAYGDLAGRTNWKSANGTVNAYPYRAIFTNGSITDNGDGTVSITIAGASGGTGNFNVLVISTGSANGFNSPPISSQTIRAGIIFDSTTFIGQLIDANTSFYRLNPSSVTLQGVITAATLGALTGNQTITASGDSTGSGATAITLTAASTQPNIHTLSGATTHTSSSTFTAAVLKSSASALSETTGMAGVSGQDIFWGDSTAHWPKFNPNATQNYIVDATSSSVTNTHMAIWSGAGSLVDGGVPLTANQTVTLSGDSSGSGATAITVTAAPTQPNIHTLSGATTFTSSSTFTSSVLGTSATLSGFMQLESVTNATINALTPGFVGQLYQCSDCATVPVCISTGSLKGQWAIITAKTTKCL